MMDNHTERWGDMGRLDDLSQGTTVELGEAWPFGADRPGAWERHCDHDP